jgi:hypothetical protein
VDQGFLSSTDGLKLVITVLAAESTEPSTVYIVPLKTHSLRMRELPF